MKQLRSLLLFLLTVCLLGALLVPGVSAAAPSRLRDGAGLLDPLEARQVLALLDEKSNALATDFVIVTADTIDGASPRAYADDFFDYQGYGQGSDRDGILLLIVMDTRDWYISTSGACIPMFGSLDIDMIGESLADALGVGDYCGGFTAFVEDCAYIVDGERNGYPFNWGRTLLISAVVGLLAALIGTAKMKGDLKSVRQRAAASDYVKADSMKVTESQELFLFRNVSRRARQTDSGGSRSHTGSSGRSHGGGGGKF